MRVNLGTWQTCFFITLKYRDRLKGMHILLSNSQAGPGETAKQEQEEISRNHVQTFFGCSVYHNDNECTSGLPYERFPLYFRGYAAQSRARPAEEKERLRAMIEVHIARLEDLEKQQAENAMLDEDVAHQRSRTGVNYVGSGLSTDF